jgi:galactose oxidase
LIDFTHQQLAAAPPTGAVTLKGLESSRCIQLSSGTALDSPLQIWDCDRSAKQTWQVVPIADNRFALKNQQSNQCLDLLYGSVADDTPAIQYTCHYNNNQQWVLMSVDANGSYMLRNAMTGTFLNVKGGTPNGAVVVGWQYANQGNQRWLLQPAS